MANAESSPFSIAAYLAFVAAAAVGVYSFVTIAKEGEARRHCSAMCLLKPAYAQWSNTSQDLRHVPNFELPDMNGKRVSMESFRGRVVVLNFWTKTCGPCMQEMPALADLTRLLSDRKDVSVLTVSADEGPSDVADTLAAVLHTREMPPFPVLFDPSMEVIKGKFGTNLFPETWIIDKAGIIRARVDGARVEGVTSWSGSAVVELVDDLRAGATCPLEVRTNQPSGSAVSMCDEIAGGT